MKEYFDTLNKELDRVHKLIQSSKNDETTRATALLQLSNLQRCFYRNSLEDYVPDAVDLRLRAPVLDIRGVSIKK